MFETPATYGKYEERWPCTSCKATGKRPAQGGLKGGGWCRQCRGNGWTSIEWNVHAPDGRMCVICGMDEMHPAHELKQRRLI